MTDVKQEEVSEYLEEESKLSKRINRIIWGALAVIAACIAVFLYWGMSNSDIIHMNEDPMEIRTIREKPQAGGVIFVYTDFCKIKNIEGDLRASFISNGLAEKFLPISKERSPKGCEKVELTIPVPLDITPGNYRIKLRASYYLNPLKRDVVEEFYSVPFDIYPKSENSLTEQEEKLLKEASQ